MSIALEQKVEALIGRVETLEAQVAGKAKAGANGVVSEWEKLVARVESAEARIKALIAKVKL